MPPFKSELQRLGLRQSTEDWETGRRILEGVYQQGQRDAVVSIDHARNLVQAMAEAASHLVTELGRLSIPSLPLEEAQVDRSVAALHRRLDLVIQLAERLPIAPAGEEVGAS